MISRNAILNLLLFCMSENRPALSTFRIRRWCSEPSILCIQCSAMQTTNALCRQLSKSLLSDDFGLEMEVPDDRLCPPVPVRWNYVRWIQDLLDTANGEYCEVPDPRREVTGLDIGVGASCIYALLACSTREKWRMAGTDVDEHSLEWAKRNVELNGLSDRIRLEHVPSDANLLLLDAMGYEEMDFVMTNPPFYSSQSDFESAYHSTAAFSRNRKTPSAVTSGAQNEMICPDGDVGFVLRILDESLRLRKRVQWYTAMLSKLSSLQQVVAKIKSYKIPNYAVTSLNPGNKTKRWAVGWSFRHYRPRNDIGRHGDLVMSILPPPTAQTIKTPMQDAKWSGRKVDEMMKTLNVKWQWRPMCDMGIMECDGDVWSRAARRRKQYSSPGAEVEKLNEGGREEDDVVALAVKITCKDEEVEVRWLRGKQHALFASICGLLKRALNER